MDIVARILFAVILVSISASSNAQGFLRTEGQEIVDENGNNFILKGMGLGGWMLQEGYMLQTAGFADAQYQIKAKIEALIGSEKTAQFYEAWLANHVRKSDIDSLKAWGFNSVRLPIHYNLFTLPIEEEPIEGENTWLDKGFELTDQLIEWCKENEMYVIIDMHAAPGGQGYDQAISDYDPTKPSIWESVPNRHKAVALWQRIAERYADEPWVAGYDLLNEPNWNTSGTVLRTLYKNMTDSIRVVDDKHIIFIEGNWFANDFTGLTPPWDDNMVYSPHKYWSVNDQASIQWVLDMREEYNVPLYLGESGENSNTWFRDAIHLLEEHNIGWAWWPMKKVESVAGPLSVEKTADYQALLDYWNDGGTAPSEEFAFETLMDLTEKLKTENCRFQPDVIDAMFRQVSSNETVPFNVQEIPGTVYCSDYDMGIVGEAYFDTDLANYSVTTGNYTSWNTGWAYRNDGVDIEVSTDVINTNGYTVGWTAAGEWMQYSVNVQEASLYDVELRFAGGQSGGEIRLAVDGSDISNSVSVPNTGGWYEWSSLLIEDVYLDPSNSSLRVYIDRAGYNINSLTFSPSGTSDEIATRFLSASTTSEQTIQMSANKPLAGPLPASPANFKCYVDGAEVNILDVSLDDDNTRLIHFSIDHWFTSVEEIKLSYTGFDVEAEDNTLLSMFTLEDVTNNVTSYYDIPGVIEAEDYFFQSGIQLENCTDTGGGQNVGYLDPGDYMDYYVNVETAGTYTVKYRIASDGSSGGLDLQNVDEDGNVENLHSVNFSPTGGWQNWETFTETVTFSEAGEQTLRIAITQPMFNINWVEFSLFSNVDDKAQDINVSLFPNPSDGMFHCMADWDQPEKASLIVRDVLGRVVYSKNFIGQSSIYESIDLRTFEAGCYFVQINVANHPAKIERLVKW